MHDVTPPPDETARKAALTAGFTLIELSVVLVIIGLIVGGVLVGQDLIHAAKIRQQLTQIDQIKTAFNTFQLKYSCLPGDCSNAGSLGFTSHQFDGCSAPLVVNGNGDGIIGFGTHLDDIYSGPGGYENLLFWSHLADAGLSTLGFPLTCPFSGANTHYGVRGAWTNSLLIMLWYDYSRPWNSLGGGQSGHYLTLAAVATNGCLDSGTGEVGELLTPLEAFQMDSKADDGLPGSGSVLATQGCSTLQLNTPYGANGFYTSPNRCVDASGNPAKYANPSTDNNATCVLNFQM